MQLTIMSDIYPDDRDRDYFDLLAVLDVNFFHGDVLILAGDVIRHGSVPGLKELLEFLKLLKYSHIIIVAGNHDHCFYTDSIKCRELLAGHNARTKMSTCWYLEDASLEIEGVTFYASPWTVWPERGIIDSMAFACTVNTIAEKWAQIPAETQVLITHMPPRGILDSNYGCERLLAQVTSIKPAMHIFGHVHQATGMEKRESTLFVNSCVQWPHAATGNSIHPCVVDLETTSSGRIKIKNQAPRDD